MTVTTISSRSALAIQPFLNTKSQLDTLTQQLGTGQKSTDYAGLGASRSLSVTLHSQLAALSSYDDTITQVGVRLDLAQQTLQQIGTIGNTVMQSAQNSQFNLNGQGQTVDQNTAASYLDQFIGLLNTQAGSRYLFSGAAGDTPTTASTDAILNGSGAQAGFKQVAAERLQADLGADGLGRLVVGGAATSVSLADDAANSPFGFKVAGVTTTVTGANVTAPTGSPPTESIDFSGSTPSAGQTVSLQLSLPDGTSTTVTLTATKSAPPGPNQFTIGADAATTASNFSAALTAAVGTEAKTSLTAASAMTAADNFFNIDASHPPQRVAGPPFDTATSLVDGTAANTVTWYTGEAGSTPAISTATARVDPSMSVSYGMRANEPAFTTMIGAIAAFATASYAPSDANGSAAYDALKQRVTTALNGQPGQQQVTDIEAQLAGAQTTMQSAKDRHTQSSATMTDMLHGIEGISQEQVGAQILALQTQLQASLQTTAMMFHTTILNYLPSS